MVSFLIKNKKDGRARYYTTALMNHKYNCNGFDCATFIEQADHLSIQTMSGERTSLLVPIDVDENGRLDFLLQHFNADGVTNGFSFIYNNFLDNYDQNFFLKLMVLYDHTKKSESEEKIHSRQHKVSNVGQKDSDIYGDLVSGASIRFVAANENYDKFVRAGSQ